MKTTLRIAAAELRYLFCSPVAWLILVIFSVQVGLSFTDAFMQQVQYEGMGYSLWEVTSSIFTGWRGIFPSYLPNLYLYIPLLTMGLMSREYSSGSIKLLFSSPINDKQIILGKYISVLVYNLVLIMPLLIITVFCGITIDNADVPLILTGVLGIYLLISAYGAIGLFMSSITQYQVVAAVGTLIVLAALNYVGEVGRDYDFVRDITYWLSISGRAHQFITGMICSEDLLYFFIVIALFICLSIEKLHVRHKKNTPSKTWGMYAGTVAAALFLGYVTSLPVCKFYYDSTATKKNTLTKVSQDIMSKLDGDLKITTYVNLLDRDAYAGLPRMRNEDRDRFERYLRFKPEIKMEYVYYWDQSTNPSSSESFFPKGLTLQEKAERMAKTMNLNYNMFLTPDKMNEIMDLTPEGHRFVRLIERGNGQKAYLRLYDDNMKFPEETEISAALKRFIVKSPKVAFLVGNGMRDIKNTGDRGYSRFANDIYFRHSLENQGFDVVTCSLESDIPEDIDIVVLADLRNPLSETENAHLENYINRGGNLFILGDTRRQAAMNSIVEQFGVSFTPGTLVSDVREDDSENPSLLIGRFTQAAADNFALYKRPKEWGQVVTMPETAGLLFDASKGFEMIPVLTTDSTYWTELQTTNFVDSIPAFNPEKGELRGAYITAMALHRQINGKDQRVVITGDADCVSNGEFGRSHGGYYSTNFTIISGTFSWLSYDEYPLNTERPSGKDSGLSISKSTFKWAKYGFYVVYPLLLVVIGMTISIRRKRN